MNNASEKKGIKGFLLGFGIFILGLLQSLTTEIGTDAFLKICELPQDLQKWISIGVIVFVFLVAWVVEFAKDKNIKGTRSLELVAPCGGGLLLLWLLELTTEVFDNLINSMVWQKIPNYILQTKGTININVTAIIVCIIMSAVFVVLGWLIYNLTKKQEEIFGLWYNQDKIINKDRKFMELKVKEYKRKEVLKYILLPIVIGLFMLLVMMLIHNGIGHWYF